MAVREAPLRVYFLLVAALASAVVLALEVLAARTLAPHLGTGAVAWSALLAVALGSLAVGNFVGGFLGDRCGAGGVVTWALVVAAGAVAALGWGYAPAMAWASELPLVGGAITAAGLTQTVPMALLGAVTPVLITAGTGPSRRSRWAGGVLACGSFGGIAGALLAGLVLLPAIGLTRGYLVVACVLAAAALPGVIAARRWVAGAALLAVLAGVIVIWLGRADGGVIHSPYGQIEARRSDSRGVLLVDGLPQTGLAGPVVPGEGLRRGYLLELALSLGRPIRHCLVIGLGGGLAPRLLEAHGLKCESVEIDASVVRAARREFGFTGRVHVADGRRFLARSDLTWDLIFLDVCTSDQLALHLFTVEALREARQRLTEGGILAIQFIGDDGPWSASVMCTVEHVFGPAVCLAAPGTEGLVGPRWIFASPRPVPPAPEPRRSPFDREAPWRVVRVRARGRLCTDDHFPAEPDWHRTAIRWRRSHGFP
jgi:spermidine synthase